MSTAVFFAAFAAGLAALGRYGRAHAADLVAGLDPRTRAHRVRVVRRGAASCLVVAALLVVAAAAAAVSDLVGA